MNLRRAIRSELPAVTALQRAAYAALKERIGMALPPHDADFEVLFETMEIWVSGPSQALEAALIVEPKPDHLLVWSLAVAPGLKGKRLGSALLDFAEDRARRDGHGLVRLYTNERFTENVAWYRRRGYLVERVEERPDRRIVHFSRDVAVPV